ncbi:hypothetical protein B0H14DRAFT_2585852 [Mycena olivaceomarginata]|nr:hypothetical protein B0H14DRAFT_2585852 [Mycena olivaceomarginata]
MDDAVGGPGRRHHYSNGCPFSPLCSVVVPAWKAEFGAYLGALTEGGRLLPTLSCTAIWGGDINKPVEKPRCEQFTREALLMELLAEESNEAPDDGALSGSGDEYEEKFFIKTYNCCKRWLAGEAQTLGSTVEAAKQKSLQRGLCTVSACPSEKVWCDGTRPPAEQLVFSTWVLTLDSMGFVCVVKLPGPLDGYNENEGGAHD